MELPVVLDCSPEFKYLTTENEIETLSPFNINSDPKCLLPYNYLANTADTRWGTIVSHWFIANKCRNRTCKWDPGLVLSRLELSRPILLSHLWDRVFFWKISYFGGAGKFCLAHGLRQLTRDTISGVSCLQTLLTRRHEKLRMTFGVGHHTTLTVNILFKISIFPIKGKKNNQSSVSDADREISTLNSTD